MDTDMHMDMMHGEAVTGTFGGHAFPGSVFLAWSAYWLALAVFRGTAAGHGRTLESGAFLPLLKIALAVAGVWIEIPGQGWYPLDVMMSWQHVAMYSAFGLSGVVELLAHAGRVSPQATFVAYAAAMGNAGFLFWGHSGHGGVEGTIHTLLALVFLATAAITLVEVVRPGGGLAWGRIGSQALLGAWFVVGGWIIYRSGWNLGDPVRQGWTYTIFSWTAVGAAVITLAGRLASRPRGAA